MNNPLTVEVVINAPIDKVWEYFNKPEHISKWAFASDDWQAESIENDLKVGGHFKTIMGAKDGSDKFDFEGIYTAVTPRKLIEYTIPDKRQVSVQFEDLTGNTKITETFEPFPEYTLEQERAGWQAILDSFKKYVENS